METTTEQTVYIMKEGKYAGLEITSKQIPRVYLAELEEFLLLVKKVPTYSRLMIELDKELKRRKK